jgi:hypothetical protein
MMHFHFELPVAVSSPVAFSTPSIPAVFNLSTDQVYPTSARANWSQSTATTVTDHRIIAYRHGTTVIAAQKTVTKGTGIAVVPSTVERKERRTTLWCRH